jgi:hypothetical protein
MVKQLSIVNLTRNACSCIFPQIDFRELLNGSHLRVFPKYWVYTIFHMTKLAAFKSLSLHIAKSITYRQMRVSVLCAARYHLSRRPLPAFLRLLLPSATRQ